MLSLRTSVSVAGVMVNVLMPGRHSAGIWVNVDSPEARFSPRYFHVLAVRVHCETHPSGTMYFRFAEDPGSRQMIMTAEELYRHGHG